MGKTPADFLTAALPAVAQRLLEESQPLAKLATMRGFAYVKCKYAAPLPERSGSVRIAIAAVFNAPHLPASSVEEYSLRGHPPSRPECFS